MTKQAVVKAVGKTERKYEGFYKAPPTVGKNFYLLAEDMYDDSNYLTTVEVASVQTTQYGYKFKTADGTEYEVHVHEKKSQSQRVGRA